MKCPGVGGDPLTPSHPFPTQSESFSQGAQMRFDIVIRNGTVVTATDTSLADVGINGDKVTAIAAQLPTENTSKIIDAAGCLVIPGGIDVHTHLYMPFAATTTTDNFHTATIPPPFASPP